MNIVEDIVEFLVGIVGLMFVGLFYGTVAVVGFLALAVGFIIMSAKALGSGLTSIGEGMASIGEGMGLLLDTDLPKPIKGKNRPHVTQQQVVEARARILAARRQIDEARRSIEAEKYIWRSEGAVEVDWGSFSGGHAPMTNNQKERLRSLGFSDVEIKGIEAMEMPPLLEGLFVAMLVTARNKAKAKTYQWWRDLGLEARPASREEARSAYSKAMLKAHPDHGGSAQQMAKVRAAWERAQKEFPSAGEQ